MASHDYYSQYYGYNYANQQNQHYANSFWFQNQLSYSGSGITGYNSTPFYSFTKESITMKKKQYGVVCIGGDLVSSHDTLEDAESAAARMASSSDYEYAVIKQIRIFRKKPVDIESIELD